MRGGCTEIKTAQTKAGRVEHCPADIWVNLFVSEKSFCKVLAYTNQTIHEAVNEKMPVISFGGTR